MLKESIKENFHLLKLITEYFIDIMPKIIPEDSEIYLEPSKNELHNFIKNKVSDDEIEYILEIISNLSGIAITNKEKYISDTSMGVLISSESRTTKQIKINLAGLMGNSHKKTKSEILNFQGKRSIKKFKSILAHELRHLIQYSDYSDEFFKKEREAKEYDYDTDPLEVDASYMESLVDNDIDDYKNIEDFVNDVMKTFSQKKPLDKKSFEKHKRKTAKFFTMYKDNNPSAVSLNNRLENYRKNIKEKVVSDFLKAVEKINSEFKEKISKDYEKYGEIPKDDRQYYYINIPKSETMSTIISKVMSNSLKNIDGKNIHLIVSSLCYSNSVSKIRHLDKVIEKLYKTSDVSKLDTIQYLKSNGYFNSEPEYIKPIIEETKKALF